MFLLSICSKRYLSTYEPFNQTERTYHQVFYYKTEKVFRLRMSSISLTIIRKSGNIVKRLWVERVFDFADMFAGYIKLYLLDLFSCRRLQHLQSYLLVNTLAKSSLYP